jgi:hypothetical protein
MLCTIMTSSPLPKPQDSLILPDIPALAVNAVQACLLTADGEFKIINHDQAQLLVHKNPVLVCHAP